MALMKCPECGKKVSTEAASCPKCGQPIDEATRAAGCKIASDEKKRGRWGCLSILVLSAVVATWMTNLGDKMDKAKVDQVRPVEASAESPASAVKPEPYFAMTADEFVKRYSAASKKAQDTQKARIKKKSDKVCQVEITKNNAVLLSLNPEGNVTGVTYIGTGDGTAKSGANIMVGMVYSLAAVRPEWGSERRIDMLKKLGMMGGAIPANSSAVDDGLQCKLMFSETTGLWLILTPTS